VSHLRRYLIVVAFSAVLALASGTFFVSQSVRDGFLPNAPAELLGVAFSALVTLFVVERAIQLAEERRWQPLTQTILWRIRAHSMHSTALLAAKCNPNIPRTHQRHDHDGRRDRLRNAVAQENCFSHLGSDEYQTLYSQIRASADVLTDELSYHQIVFSKLPDLYRAIVKVENDTLGWSAYHEAELQYEVTGQEENPIICQVARAFLALHSELGKIPSGE